MADALRPAPGDTALDLFCGAGLFAGVLAEAVGPDGTVIGVEAGYRRQSAMPGTTCGPAPWARVHKGDAADVLAPVRADRRVGRRARPAANRRGPRR